MSASITFLFFILLFLIMDSLTMALDTCLLALLSFSLFHCFSLLSPRKWCWIMSSGITFLFFNFIITHYELMENGAVYMSLTITILFSILLILIMDFWISIIDTFLLASLYFFLISLFLIMDLWIPMLEKFLLAPPSISILHSFSFWINR